MTFLIAWSHLLPFASFFFQYYFFSKLKLSWPIYDLVLQVTCKHAGSVVVGYGIDIENILQIDREFVITCDYCLTALRIIFSKYFNFINSNNKTNIQYHSSSFAQSNHDSRGESFMLTEASFRKLLRWIFGGFHFFYCIIGSSPIKSVLFDLCKGSSEIRSKSRSLFFAIIY